MLRRYQQTLSSSRNDHPCPWYTTWLITAPRLYDITERLSLGSILQLNHFLSLKRKVTTASPSKNVQPTARFWGESYRAFPLCRLVLWRGLLGLRFIQNWQALSLRHWVVTISSQSARWCNLQGPPDPAKLYSMEALFLVIRAWERRNLQKRGVIYGNITTKMCCGRPPGIPFGRVRKWIDIIGLY